MLMTLLQTFHKRLTKYKKNLYLWHRHFQGSVTVLKSVQLKDVENVNNIIFADPRFEQMRFQFNIFDEGSYFDINEIFLT